MPGTDEKQQLLLARRSLRHNGSLLRAYVPGGTDLLSALHCGARTEGRYGANGQNELVTPGAFASSSVPGTSDIGRSLRSVLRECLPDLPSSHRCQAPMKNITRSSSGAALGEYALEQSLGRHRQFRTREQLGGLFAQAGYSADVHLFCAVLVAGQPDFLL